MEHDEGTIANWLKDNKAYVTYSSPVDNGGKYAVTHFHVLDRTVSHSLVEYRLETGRKNQIVFILPIWVILCVATLSMVTETTLFIVFVYMPTYSVSTILSPINVWSSRRQYLLCSDTCSNKACLNGEFTVFHSPPCRISYRSYPY